MRPEGQTIHPSRDRPFVASGRRRSVAILAAVAVVVSLVAWGVTRVIFTGGVKVPLASGCRVVTKAGTSILDLEQGANAATIAAVGHKLALPDHAVTVALATALQESKLVNLTGGDRDSVGLFQQRPSQGWGTPSQLINPLYATSAFYNALTKVPGWQTLEVTRAAQDVQHSAAPSAYAVHEAEARTLAVALTGEAPAAFSCRFHPTRRLSATSSALWRSALGAELGDAAPGTPVSASTGWTLAGWLVGHAPKYGFASVSFEGRTWRPGPGQWVAGGAADGAVHVT